MKLTIKEKISILSTLETVLDYNFNLKQDIINRLQSVINKLRIDLFGGKIK